MFDKASISNNLKTQSLTLYLTLCRHSSSSRAQVTVSGYSHPAIADISPASHCPEVPRVFLLKQNFAVSKMPKRKVNKNATGVQGESFVFVLQDTRMLKPVCV